MPNYKLSELSQNDLTNIRDYSIETWGEKQAEKYMGQLESRFEWLVVNPKLGLERDEIKEGYQSYFEGKHTIFYRETSEGIEIIGVPSQSEDVIQHLSIEHTQEVEPSEMEY